MNGLVLNYHLSDHCNKKEIKKVEEKRSKEQHYQTWPRTKLSSKRCKIFKTINQIKCDQAISELDLTVVTSKKLLHFLHEEIKCNSKSTYHLNKAINHQKGNNFLKEYDKKLKLSDGVVQNRDYYLSTVGYRSSFEHTNDLNCKSEFRVRMKQNISEGETSFYDQKLGIEKLLKNWELSEDVYEKNQEYEVSFSDIRSSVSSINTFNESDNLSICSDVNNVTISPFKNSKNSEYHGKIISSSHLIQYHRPESLPPKPLSEQMKHQKEYEKMVEAVKKKERDKDLMLRKKRENRLKEEEKLSQSTHAWLNEILPNWSSMKNTRKIYNLWWNGLPPCVRGKVWSLSVGNKLNITREQYIQCVKKSKEILRTGSRDFLQVNESYEHSVELIRLDISRTFPHLCIFQQGGPYYDTLYSLLGAFVCYQPTIGYVQGMSFIAAVLLLNMDELDAFICFANMLNKPCHKAFYSLDVPKMKTYYLVYSDLLRVNMYDLYKHINETALSPDLYLVDWVYTLFSKSMNLDLACRIWDLVFRDGETFIFRAALGIMHLFRPELLKMDFLRSAQYLTKLPEDLCAEKLFKSISRIRLNNGSLTFEDLLEQYTELIKTPA